MQEAFLHFVWQYRRFNHRDLQTTAGLPIQILRQGNYNLHDGPDFIHARIKIGNTLWAGHVELHVRSSDWLRHGHAKDPKYNNTILHVVYEDDVKEDIAGCATLELIGLIPRSIYDRYLSLMQSPDILPCHHLLPDIDTSTLFFWKGRLLAERMEKKTARIQELLHATRNDWEQVAFIWLMRYFGAGINTDGFQHLATLIPIKHLSRIADDTDQVAALLFGAAGMLEEDFEEDYPQLLKHLFRHLANKWKIIPMPRSMWKWKHARPATFPGIRIAQLAVAIPLMFPLVDTLLSPSRMDTLLAGVHPHVYWDNHYRFGEASVSQPKPITRQMTQLLMANVSVPLMLAFARHQDDGDMVQEAMEILQQLPAEDNRFTRAMEAQGLSNEHAADSQSLMELKVSYCDLKQCLRCAIGNKILRPEQLNDGDEALLLKDDATCV